jgi:uncharacterized membrane protein
VRTASSRRRQVGAVAVFAAIAAGAGLAALALAIDVGRLYAAQRELQRTANVAALDAARVAGGCFGLQQNAAAAAYDETVASVARNDRRGEIRTQQVDIGRVVGGEDGRRRFDPDFERDSHAVRVVLSRTAPARLLPLLPAAGKLTAVAAAHSRPYAMVHVGSRLAQLDAPTLNGLFERLFGGGQPNVSALGYTSLLEASVPLNEVITILEPGSPGGIDTRPISVAEVLRRLVDALGDAGNDIAATAARGIADAADASATIAPGELVMVQHEAARLLGSTLINAGELTLLVAQAASESAVIEMLYTLPPPLGDSSVLVRIIDPGTAAPLTSTFEGGDVDDNFASNAQAVLQATLGVDVPGLGQPLRLPVWLQLAQATATVSDIQCARDGRPQDIVTIVARSSISRIGIGDFDDIRAPQPRPQPATLLDMQAAAGLLGLPLPVRVRVTASAMVDLPSDRRELVIPGPYPSPPQTIGGPDTVLLREAAQDLPRVLDLQVRIEPAGGAGGGVLGLGDAALAALIDGARAQLEQLLAERIASTLLAAADPLLARALQDTGLTLGGADVRVESLVAREPFLFTR